MTHTISSVQQNVYNSENDPIVVEDVDENAVSLPVLRRLINSAQGGIVGVAATYRPDCTLSCLAFATHTRALVVHFYAQKKPNPYQQQRKQKKKGQEQQPPVFRGRPFLRDHILCNPGIQLYGYRMDRITLALFLDLSLRINAAIDILSVSNSDRRSFDAVMNALGGELLLQKQNVKTLYAHREVDETPATKDVAIQAWAACQAATLAHMTSRYAALSRIATDTMPDVVCNLHLSQTYPRNLIHNVASECPGKDISRR